MIRAIIFVVFGIALCAPVSAAVEAVQWETAQQQRMYVDLIDELRCLVCANQSLSDSNADLAKDLRGKVREMIARGQTREEIINYMVDRYGEYVLYRPRFSATTFFLWVAPFVLALIGLLGIIVIVKRSRQPDTYSAEALQQTRALIEDDNE